MAERSALVAYATETGNAYDFAEELARLLERIHFHSHTSHLDALTTDSLREYTIVFLVISTTGQGDLPGNGRSFWKSLLRKKLPSTYLRTVQFSTFGLGDSSYPKFNWAARKVHKRLLQLGANELYPRGEADEQHEDGLDASFVPWSSDLRLHLLAKYPLPPEIVPISEDKFLEPKWKLSLGAREQNKNWNGDTEPTLSKAAQEINPHSQLSDISKSSNISPRPSKLRVTLRENFRMTPPGHWQDVRRLIFTSEEQGAYSPGDVLTIHPKNHEDDVEQILMRMKWTDVSDQPIYHTPTMVKSADNKHPPPPFKSTRNITLRSLLTTSLDITAIPRRSFFSFIAHFTDDQFQKDRLLEFSKPEYIDEFHDYTTRPRRSILEVLQEFESVKIPWQWAGSVFPELRGRQFSIASGGKHKTTSTGTARFELLVAIVKYKTVIKKVREGVCTRYLASLQVGTSLDITLQQGGLAVKKEEARLPVIMIGPGTGVAPMRSLIWERKLWSQDTRITNGAPASDSVSNIGKSVLFFGCREKHADYFYREEWEEMKDDWLFEVHPAFSRDQSQKIYVQDLIRDHSKSVFEILHHEGGLIYVCGSSGMMPKSVRASLIDVFMNCGDMDQDAAHNFLESLEKQGRYKQETW